MEFQKELSSAINQIYRNQKYLSKTFQSVKQILLSKTKPKSTKDILGISGRIVKLEKNVLLQEI